MPFNWNDYLTLAEQLATMPDEAAKRTAISRAYYCVFNLAFARAELNAGPWPGAETMHKWCWSKYRATPDPSCRKLGIDGDRMKAKRVRADYKPADIPRLDDEVGRMLEEARQFQTAFQALPPRFPLP
jgi:hypothetical protein